MAAVMSPQFAFPEFSRATARLTRPICSRLPTEATYLRRRAVALLVLIVLSLGCSLLASFAVSSVGEFALSATAAPAAPAIAASPIAARSYVVQQGDSFWTIARRLQPDGDVRPLVDRLAQRHGGSALQAGERLDFDGLQY